MLRPLPALLFTLLVVVSGLQSARADSLKTLLDQATAAHEAGNIKQAIVLMTAAVRAAPKRADLRFGLGLLYLEAGQRKSAAANFERVTRAQPKHFDAQFNLGKLLSELGRHKEAIRHLQAALRLRPKDPEVPLELAVAELANGDASKARARLDALSPKTSAILSLLAFVSLRLADIPVAVTYAQSALKRSPNTLRNRLTLATALVHAGAMKEARGHLKRLIRAGPKTQANVPYTLALADWLSGNPVGARRWLAEASARAPGAFKPSRKGFQPLAFANDTDLAFLAWAEAHPGAPAAPEARIQTLTVTGKGCLPGPVMAALMDQAVPLQRCLGASPNTYRVTSALARHRLTQTTAAPRGAAAGCIQKVIHPLRIASLATCAIHFKVSSGR